MTGRTEEKHEKNLSFKKFKGLSDIASWHTVLKFNNCIHYSATQLQFTYSTFYIERDFFLLTANSLFIR
jgi:hypothetical protein